MLLSRKTSIKLNSDYVLVISRMCYAAYKLWNICNYERYHYTELSFPEGVNYPDWYYQKSAHKDDFWFKQLPAQTAQEVCKLLDKSWKSFYKLEKTCGIENPHPPYYKHNPVAITYMQKGIVHKEGSNLVRLSLPKALKKHIQEVYDLHDEYIYLKNQIFKNMDVIKQIKIYPPKNDVIDVIIIYEVADVNPLPDNGNYLSIDLGVHNLMTCFSSVDGSSFIVGRKYLSICNYYAKTIAYTQSRWYEVQAMHGVKNHYKGSKHIESLYKKRDNTVLDYLHKITRYIVNYCIKNNINTVVIGDITNIRKDKDYGCITNQKFHALPFKKIYTLLEYKLKLCGITLIKRKEAYSSQCSPLSIKIDKRHANKSKRKHRGLYVDESYSWNADTVGAYNILRLYLGDLDKTVSISPLKIKPTYIVKVAV